MNEYALTTEMLDLPVNIKPFRMIDDVYHFNDHYKNYYIDIYYNKIKISYNGIEETITNLKGVKIDSGKDSLFMKSKNPNFPDQLKANLKDIIYIDMDMGDEFCLKIDSNKNLDIEIKSISFTIKAIKKTDLRMKDRIDRETTEFLKEKSNAYRYKKVLLTHSLRPYDKIENFYPHINKYKILNVPNIDEEGCITGFVGTVCVMSKEQMVDLAFDLNERISIDTYRPVDDRLFKYNDLEDLGCDYRVTVIDTRPDTNQKNSDQPKKVVSKNKQKVFKRYMQKSTLPCGLDFKRFLEEDYRFKMEVDRKGYSAFDYKIIVNFYLINKADDLYEGVNKVVILSGKDFDNDFKKKIILYEDSNETHSIIAEYHRENGLLFFTHDSLVTSIGIIVVATLKE